MAGFDGGFGAEALKREKALFIGPDIAGRARGARAVHLDAATGFTILSLGETRKALPP
jgi:hypothetical protein